MKLQAVHLRINDAATGKPTPVRLRVTGPDNTYYAPLGRLARFARGVNEDVGGNVQLDGMNFCHIDGACEIDLPAGPVRIEAYKGYEYGPLQQEVHLKPGQLAIRLSIERVENLRAEGWHSGDTRCLFLSPHAALLEAAAEDLAVVHLLACEWRAGNLLALPNLLAFSGQSSALEMPGHSVAVNTYNISPLGSLALLHCHRVVHPLHVGRINWTLADWCDQCHRKGGLVTAALDTLTASEALANVLLGRVDALETTDLDWLEEPENIWYDLLNCGFRVPLVGASGKQSNRQVLGATRTYAQLPSLSPPSPSGGEGRVRGKSGRGEGAERAPGTWSHQAWIEAVGAGRTFVTTGPLLDFTIDGQGPGTTVEAASGWINLSARVRGVVPARTLEIVHNGKVLLDCGAVTHFETELPAKANGWWAVRCRGEGAHTAPIYVRADASDPPAPQSLARIHTALNKFATHVNNLATHDAFNTPHDLQRVRNIIDDATRKLTVA